MLNHSASLAMSTSVLEALPGKLDSKRHSTENMDGWILKQVAQWSTIAHHGASIMFGDTIIYDVQRQITLNLKQ